jgi:hypothetical protein
MGSEMGLVELPVLEPTWPLTIEDMEDLTAVTWELQAIQQMVTVDIKATSATHESTEAQMDVKQHN